MKYCKNKAQIAPFGSKKHLNMSAEKLNILFLLIDMFLNDFDSKTYSCKRYDMCEIDVSFKYIATLFHNSFKILQCFCHLISQVGNLLEKDAFASNMIPEFYNDSKN